MVRVSHAFFHPDLAETMDLPSVDLSSAYVLAVYANKYSTQDPVFKFLYSVSFSKGKRAHVVSIQNQTHTLVM